jgi:hypothetical protein
LNKNHTHIQKNYNSKKKNGAAAPFSKPDLGLSL